MKWWNPELYQRKVPYLQERQKIINSVRNYFDGEGFLEVETPAVQVSPGLEVHLKAFKTELEEPFTGEKETLYLHTSPEFTMKKLLVAGLPKIYQLCHVYRNGERSERHHPEFTMIEWYRANDDYYSIMEDCKHVLRNAATCAGKKVLTYQGYECDPFKEWEMLTIQEAFLKYADVDVLATIDDPDNPDPDPKKLMAEAKRIGINYAENDRWEDVFFRICLDRVEPKLGFNGVPTIFYEYPKCLAALSRKKPTDPRVSERFEFYVCGLEMGNAFSELTDVTEQRKRFTADMDMKEQLYGERYPIDEDFMDALTFGMPPAAGIAVGVDRLIMVVTGAPNIDDVLWAPVAKK